MGSHLLLTCLLTAALLLLLPSNAQQHIDTRCDFGNSGNYAANSTFETNLNTLLAILYSSTPSSSGFLTSYSGTIPERAYGLALCRGDVSSSACSSCLDLASENLPQSCPYNKNAIAWYDECFLRYGATRFASIANKDLWVYTRNGENISTPDWAQFSNSMMTLLNGLRSYAVTDATAPQLFAAGEMDIGGARGYEKVYGLVQCTRDITAADCNSCLDLIKDLPRYCVNAIGGRVVTASCNARYDVRLFFNWPRSIVLPRPSLPPAVPAPAATPVNSKLMAYVRYGCLDLYPSSTH